MHHFIAIGELKPELQSGNAQFGSKSTNFRAVWPWKLMDDLKKQKETSPKQHQALCIVSSSYVNSTWSYSPGTDQLGYDLCDLDLWPMTLTFCMKNPFVIGNNSWKFCDDTITGTLWKRCDRQTDGRTERGVLRAASSQLKITYKLVSYLEGNMGNMYNIIMMCYLFHNVAWLNIIQVVYAK